MSTGTLEYARAVADAVLYEGYLLYPYRASSSKNQSRWQFGVLGPPGAAGKGIGEDAALGAQFVVRAFPHAGSATVAVRVRFLQLQKRSAQRVDGDGEFVDVHELAVGDRRWLTWDEAVEREIALGPWPVADLASGRIEALDAPAGEQREEILDDAGAAAGRLVRTHREVRAQLSAHAEAIDGTADLFRLSIRVQNCTPAADSKDAAIAASLIGAHLLVSVEHGEFASMTDPPDDAMAAVAGCAQHRCWPVLAGPQDDRTVMLLTPIILGDHPEIAPQSSGSLFDSTEIDEILTLRVMTLTDEEKAAARATDPRAAEIIDRCDALTPEAMQQLHGVLRDPHAVDAVDAVTELDALLPHGSDVDLSTSLGFDDEIPWWDPAVDGSVAPNTDEVVIDGVAVAAGSIVRIHPARRADAQDIFFADQIARVSAVHSDVDGDTHVAVVLQDDPAAELHDWYGRYLYFAPDELEPMPASAPSSSPAADREERRP